MEKNVMYEFDVANFGDNSNGLKPVNSGVIRVMLDTGSITIQVIDGEIVITKSEHHLSNRLQICPVVGNRITIK